MTIERINRRAYLGALSTGTGIVLAGCTGGESGKEENGADDGDEDSGGGGGDHGEIVPEIQLESMTGVSGASNIESVMGHIAEVIEDTLGVPVDLTVKEVTTMWDETYNDNRSQHFHLDLNVAFPSLLDPSNVFRSHIASRAGANGQNNMTQYASCEYTERYEEQDTLTGEERQRAVNEAASVWSEDIHTINLCSQVTRGSYRSDQIEVDDEVGDMGATYTNADYLVTETIPTGDADAKVMNVSDTVLESSTYMVNQPISTWANTIYSSLVYYDKHLELQPHLATDWDIEENETFTYQLREDATFHNGDPVTAEDAKFTFEHLQENSHVYNAATEQPYESIDVIDDYTVQFTLETPSAGFHTSWVPQWGIAPRDAWIEGGAESDPANIDDDQALIGSGPYEVVTWRRGELLQAEPVEDHWHEPQGDFIMEVYHDEESALRAFEEGSINLVTNIAGQHVEMLEESMSETSQSVVAPQFTNWWIMPQMNFGPSKFKEFRHALSQAVDREFVSEVLEFGQGETHLYSSPFGKTYPFYPDDPDEVLTPIADSPTSNPERAREVLEEAGWTWDDDGRLHYPQGADLDPLWPEGDEPADHPDQFPCLADQ